MVRDGDILESGPVAGCPALTGRSVPTRGSLAGREAQLQPSSRLLLTGSGRVRFVGEVSWQVQPSSVRGGDAEPFCWIGDHFCMEATWVPGTRSQNGKGDAGAGVDGPQEPVAV